MLGKRIVIEEPCHCGNACEVRFGDRCSGGRLTWYKSILCRSCGRAEELDDTGSLPEDLRNVLLQQEGEWNLAVTKVGEGRALLLKQLRKFLGLTIPEAADVARSLPGLLRSGTYAEMTCLKKGLELDGRDWDLEIVRRQPMDISDTYRALCSHLDHHWPTEEKSDFIWNLGPIRESLPRFRVRRIAPGSTGAPWIYVSVGAWEVPLEGTDRLEFFILSPEETPRHVETLAMLANFHADPRYRLQEGSIINIGHGWLEGSQATHLLVTLPYTLGPDVEKCQVEAMEVRFLWLVPITEPEARLAHSHGRLLLENRLEEADIDPTDPLRPSVVLVDEL